MTGPVQLALMLAAALTLLGCHTRPAQDDLHKSIVAQNPAAPANEPSPPVPNPVPLRPVLPDPTPTPQASAPAAAPPAPTRATVAPAKPATSAPKAPPKAALQTPPAAPAAAPTAAKPAPLDLDSLEQRLKDTRAIGVFTKLSLKNQVDDLLDDLKEFHKGASKLSPSVLRQKYDLLIIKVLSLLQDGDPPLASAISSSREAIWQILMDPSKFAKI